MVDMDALKQAVAELQGIINTADGRDMVARRKPPEAVPGEDQVEEPEEMTVEVEAAPPGEGEDEEMEAMSPEERRKLIGY